MSILKQTEQGTPVTLLTTELNSLANNSNQISSVGGTSGVFSNTQGTSNFDGYVRGKVEFVMAAYTGTPAVNSGLSLWFIKSVDGTNYDDGGSSVTPIRAPDVFIQVRALTSGPQRIIRECWVPVGTWKVLARNEGTGITWASSANTVKLLLSSDEAP